MPRRFQARLSYANVTATLAVFIALGGGAFAATSLVGSGGTITACVNKKRGTARVVAAGKKCKKGEQRLTWNQRGANGDRGLQGDRGPQGDAGKQGVAGPPGPATGAAGGALTGSYPNPTIASGAITGPELGDGTVSSSKLAAGIPRDVELVSGASPMNSSDKSASIECPAGKSAISGGAAAPTSGATGFVAMTVSRPKQTGSNLPPAGIADATGWFASAIEVNGGSVQQWGIDIYVICARL